MKPMRCMEVPLPEYEGRIDGVATAARRYEGPYGSSGTGDAWGTPGMARGAGRVRGGASAIAIAGAANPGSCGLAASWRTLWHARIDGPSELAGFSWGQWHFAGSGQQQVIVVETVRSCEIGT